MNIGDGVVQFTGKDMDFDTGLFYYNARWYDPDLGRFVTEDPIKDGNNWYVYVANNPLRFIDPTGLELILTIYNRDPSPGANQIANFSTGKMDVGHTWIGIEDTDTGKEKYYGWGHPDTGDPSSGKTVPGSLLNTESENTQGGPATSTYSKLISKKEAEDMADLWNDKDASGTGYNYGGKAIDPNATFCTEAVVDSLTETGVLSKEEEEILNGGYNEWEKSYPDPMPGSVEDLAKDLEDLTSPNPNEMEERMNGLNDAEDGSIICTELYRQGLMDSFIFEADQLFGIQIEQKYPLVKKGYLILARPVVTRMQKSEIFTKIVNKIAKPWSYEMAYQTGYRAVGDLGGKLIMVLGIPLCYLIGLISHIKFLIHLIFLSVLIAFAYKQKRYKIIKIYHTSKNEVIL